MKIYRIGVNGEGRSTIAEERSADPAPVTPTLAVNILAETFASPPELDVPRRAVDARFTDLAVAPGGARWVSFSLPAGERGELHHTSTLDYQVVVASEVTVGTEDGEALLRTGDCVLIPGLEHSWSTGPQGCTLVGVAFGLLPA